jgi:hypothetical protein
MNNFVIGDRVVDATGRTGEITNGFYRRGVKPQQGEVAVQWDDGEATYISPAQLDFESVPA